MHGRSLPRSHRVSGSAAGTCGSVAINLTQNEVSGLKIPQVNVSWVWVARSNISFPELLHTEIAEHPWLTLGLVPW